MMLSVEYLIIAAASSSMKLFLLLNVGADRSIGFTITGAPRP